MNERRRNAHGVALGAVSELRRRLLPPLLVPPALVPFLPALSSVGAAGAPAGGPPSTACAGATVTWRLSASWVNPVVTTRSPAFTPRVTTAWVSFCWPTLIALTDTVSFC